MPGVTESSNCDSRGRAAAGRAGGARYDNHSRRPLEAPVRRPRRAAALALAVAALVALVALAPWSTAGADSHTSARTTPPGLLVGVGNHQLHINCAGTGSPAVVFESGLGGTSLEWSKVQPQVTQFTEACSYDRGGYGWSQGGPGPRDARRLAAELDMLLVYASVRPPYVLVGHSFGGLTVRMFAERRSDRVAGLVLVDSTHERQFQRLPQAGVRTPAAPTGRTFVIANHWSVPSGLPPEISMLARRLALRPKAVKALYGELAAMRASARQVGAIGHPLAAPVVVLSRAARTGAGALDGAWLEMQRDLADAMPDGSLVVVPDSGHHIHLDRPEQVVRAIRSIVREARSTQDL